MGSDDVSSIMGQLSEPERKILAHTSTTAQTHRGRSPDAYWGGWLEACGP